MDTSLKKLSTKELVLLGAMAAVIAIISPLSIPLGFSPVPITLGLLAIYITAYVLKPMHSFFAVLLYILIGVIGLPVFSGYKSGFAVLLGPTAGFLIGYLPTVFISSYFIRLRENNRFFHALGMSIGLIICYILGSLWFSISLNRNFQEAINSCVIPFIPADIAKIVIALIVGPELLKRLKNI